MNAKNPRDVIIRPVISEKSYAANEVGVYTFIVAPDANKIEIRQAVEQIFGVKVAKVNTVNRKGKRKRNRVSRGWSQRSSQKRALVTLVDGTIDILGS